MTQPVVLNERSLPDRLRYLAEWLRGPDASALTVSAVLDTLAGQLEDEGRMTPSDITDAVLDMACGERMEDWQEAHPDDVEAAEHLDQPLIEIVWTAAWEAAVDACATGGQGTAAARIAALEAECAALRVRHVQADELARSEERDHVIALIDAGLAALDSPSAADPGFLAAVLAGLVTALRGGS